MDYQTVSKAITEGGSIREAARRLGKSYTAVQWWLARNGYRVEYHAVLVPIKFELTEKGKQAVEREDK